MLYSGHQDNRDENATIFRAPNLGEIQIQQIICRWVRAKIKIHDRQQKKNKQTYQINNGMCLHENVINNNVIRASRNMRMNLGGGDGDDSNPSVCVTWIRDAIGFYIFSSPRASGAMRSPFPIINSIWMLFIQLYCVVLIALLTRPSDFCHSIGRYSLLNYILWIFWFHLSFSLFT